MFTNTSLAVRFQKIDAQLGAIVIGIEVTRLGASHIGAKLCAHVGVNTELAVTWQPAWRQYNWCRAPVLTLQLLFLPESISFSSYGANCSGALDSEPYTMVLSCIVIASQVFAIWPFLSKIHVYIPGRRKLIFGLFSRRHHLRR
jgi:hypothetical protein